MPERPTLGHLILRCIWSSGKIKPMRKCLRFLPPVFGAMILCNPCAGQEQSLAERARAIREGGPQQAFVAREGESLAEKANVLKEGRQHLPGAIGHVYTNDDFASATRAGALNRSASNVPSRNATPAEVAERQRREFYHGRARQYWIDMEPILIAAKQRELEDPNSDFVRRANAIAAQITDPGRRASYLKANFEWSPEPQQARIKQQAAAQRELDLLYEQCGREPGCRQEWLNLAPDERPKYGGYPDLPVR